MKNLGIIGMEAASNAWLAVKQDDNEDIEVFVVKGDIDFLSMELQNVAFIPLHKVITAIEQWESELDADGA